MIGFITEREFPQAELEFPGIVALYDALPRKPTTFLELLQQYLFRTMPPTREVREVRSRHRRAHRAH